MLKLSPKIGDIFQKIKDLLDFLKKIDYFFLFYDTFFLLLFGALFPSQSLNVS